MDELEVQWLLPDGRTGGRTAEGTTVRLSGAAVPGDHVIWTSSRRRGRTIDATMEYVVTPSPDRRKPSCPWDETCGGCDLAALQPESRHLALAHMVGRAFRRDESPEVVPSPRPRAHRARIGLSIQDGQVGYRRPRSHVLVPIDQCEAARPELNEALERLRAWLTVHPSPFLERVELRSDGNRCILAFSSKGPVPRSARSALAELGDVALDGKSLHGNPKLRLQVGGVLLQASPRSFYQVNLEANALLVDHVLESITGCERVLDLYSGIGNFSLPLAAQAVGVVAVESQGQAVEDLRAAAREQELTVETIARRAERFDPSRVAFDGVILDPPRAGARGVLGRVVRNRPRRVVYVSCHAPSAARDLKEAPGYRIASIRCFDLFPDTHHIETVVVLDRV